MNHNLFKTILSILYPKKCIGCGEIIEEQNFLCNYCDQNIESFKYDDLCLSCGFEKQSCVCKSHIFHFHNIVSLYKNEGIAQKAYYSYKFAKKEHYSQFFAKQMSILIQKCYNGINFDYVCCVPTEKRSVRKRGFDHTTVLAKKLSKIIQVPFRNDILKCNKFRKPQHNSSLKERFDNVKNKYTFISSIKGGSILLVDDIRTSGATLDECAKMLLFAGADKVYCITVLGTTLKKRKTKIEK